MSGSWLVGAAALVLFFWVISLVVRYMRGWDAPPALEFILVGVLISVLLAVGLVRENNEDVEAEEYCMNHGGIMLPDSNRCVGFVGSGLKEIELP